MEDRNIKVATLDLGTIERMPNDALALVISGPKAIFQDKEVKLLRNFLNQEPGSSLIGFRPSRGNGTERSSRSWITPLT
jgi:hypothetical protein